MRDFGSGPTPRGACFAYPAVLCTVKPGVTQDIRTLPNKPFRARTYQQWQKTSVRRDVRQIRINRASEYNEEEINSFLSGKGSLADLSNSLVYTLTLFKSLSSKRELCPGCEKYQTLLNISEARSLNDEKGLGHLKRGEVEIVATGQ